MTPHVHRQIQKEVTLIDRFAETYRRKLSVLIDRLNQPNKPDPLTDVASLRLCVEAVDMMLSNQSEIARMLRDIADKDHDRRPAVRAAAA